MGERSYLFHGIETKADTAVLKAPINGKKHPFVKHFEFLRDLVKEEDVIVKFTIPSPSQFYFELIRTPEHIVARALRLNNGVIANALKDLVINTHVCRGNFHSTWIFQGGYNKVEDE